MSTHAGKHFGRYRLDDSIGRGGMAEVYRAWDEKLERTVAVKVILPGFAADPELRDRFQREARLVAGLEHPNILPVFDFGEEDGLPYLVMPYLDGGTLASRLGEAPMTRLAVTDVVRQLGGALDAAHAAGVLHRDVKPSNVLVAADGRLVLADFGIAKLFDSSTRLTQTGAMVGTPVFMAPEIARGEPATPASDLYSLACLAFQLLTGEPPFRGENALSLLHQHVHDPVPSVRARRPELEPDLEAVLRRALAKDPRERPPSGAALAQALAGAEATLPLAATGREGRVGAGRREASPSTSVGAEEQGRSRVPLFIVASVAASALLATGLWLVAKTRPSDAGRVEVPLETSSAGAADESGVAGATVADSEQGDRPRAAADVSLQSAGDGVGPLPPSTGSAHPNDREEAGEESAPAASTPPATPRRGAVGTHRRDRTAAFAAPSPVPTADELWLDGRPSCEAFTRLGARLEASPGPDPGAAGRRTLGAWAAAGAAYCEGDRESARSRLEEIASLPVEVRQGSLNAPLRFLRPGAITDWQLALALGDPLGEAAELLDTAAGGAEAGPGVELARAVLDHLDGDHLAAAGRARSLLERSEDLRVRPPELAAFAIDELLHAREIDEALRLLPELAGDPPSVRRVVRSLEHQGGVEALRRACEDAGWRPACAASRRRR